jgi:hypothetical protein
MSCINASRRHWLGKSVAAAMAYPPLSLSTSAHAAKSIRDDFHFVLIGDTPYSKLDEYSLKKILLESTKGASFVIHVGDIKGGREPCTDELISSRLALLGESPVPLIYTPGDNEWVDCDNGALNRLEFIRKQVFLTGNSLGKGSLVTQMQASQPENRRWMHRGILFVTLNVPGSNNGVGLLPEAHINHRMAENKVWLNTTFEQAKASDCAGVVVILHANMGLNTDGFYALKGKSLKAYGDFRDSLIRAFTELKKPSLLLHGDSHRFTADRPLESAPTLQRVESFGYPFTSAWVRVSVAYQNPALFVVSANHL